jgi:tripartite ATP-independent transporter DctM subunit
MAMTNQDTPGRVATEAGIARPVMCGLNAADAFIETALNWSASFLVVADTLILLIGVTARYVFRAPLVWSDELASLLFMWLAMFGAIIAYRRGEHMRMTFFVRLASPATRVLFDTFAVTSSLLFLIFIFMPSVEHADDARFIVTAGLGIQAFWRSGALAAGFALMIFSGVVRLARAAEWRALLICVLLLAVLVCGFMLASPMLPRLGMVNLVIFFIGVTAFGVFSGVPIAFSFGLATLGYIEFTTMYPASVIVSRIEEGMSHLILLAVPLFVFLGLLMQETGMAKAMVEFLVTLLGRVRGGLSYVLVGAMYLVSGISGAKAADMAAVAPILFPEMKKRGANPGDMIALLSATGAQTETIPPSIVLITIGSVTGVSIQALFTGGLLPGALLGVSLCFMVWRRYHHDDVSQARRYTLTEIGKISVYALPALVLPFLIRAAVVGGVTTATEVSTVGIAYAAVVGILVYRDFRWKQLIPMLVQTASLSGAILFIIGAATAMAWALTQSGFSNRLADVMVSLPGGGVTFMVVSIVAFMLLGSVLEGIPSIVLFGPLLFPIAERVGIHEVHYAIVVILSMGIGLFTPPFGVGYYMTCAIGQVDPDEGMRPIWGYMLALFIGILVLAAIPWLSIGFL